MVINMKVRSIEIGLSYLQHLKGGEEVEWEWYERDNERTWLVSMFNQ